MTYYMPTKVYEEADCVKAHGAELAALGTKAMLVTGRHSAKANGSEQDVAEVLTSFGIPYVVFDQIEENPSVETIFAARDVAVAEGADLFIGIGGGSPMDAAKAISLMAYHKTEGEDFLFAGDPKAQWYPVVAVPTTCGTGSEVTGISVLTLHQQKTKSSIPYRIFPELALVDGKYLAFAPAHVLLNTAIDTLCHLTESYINATATDYSRMVASAGLSLWSKSKDFLLAVGRGEEVTADEETRGNLMRASTLGGIAIAQTGTSLPHGLSYGLTYAEGIAHGKACGQFLAGYVKNASVKDRTDVLTLTGFETVEELEAFLDATSGREALSEDILETLVSQLASLPAKLKNAPFPVDKDVLRNIAHNRAS